MNLGASTSTPTTRCTWSVEIPSSGYHLLEAELCHHQLTIHRVKCVAGRRSGDMVNKGTWRISHTSQVLFTNHSPEFYPCASHYVETV